MPLTAPGTRENLAAPPSPPTADLSTAPRISIGKTLFWLALLYVYFIVGMLSLSAGHAWGDDWAQYIMHAQNLLRGRPYVDTLYVFNPDWAQVGPPAYPPMTAILLAPVVAIFGVSLPALKIYNLLLLVAALPLIYLVVARMAGSAAALVAVVLFAGHDVVAAFRNAIGSEAPFILLSFLTLWVAARLEDTHSDRTQALLSGAAIGLVAYLAFASRAVGLAAIFALLLYGVLQRKPAKHLAVMIGTFVLCAALQSALIVEPPRYENELMLPTVSLVLSNIYGYLWSLAVAFRMPLKLSLPMAIAVVLLAGLGIWSLIGRRSEASGIVGDWIARARRIPLPVWYILGYFGILVLSAIPPGVRYCIPVLPILVGLAWMGCVWIAERVPLLRIPYADKLALLGVVGYCFVLNASAIAAMRNNGDQSDNAMCVRCMEMYRYVNETVPPGTLVAFAKPRAMGLFAHRPSWRWGPEYTSEELPAKLAAVKAGLIVLARPGRPLSEITPSEAHIKVLRSSGWETSFQNDHFEVLKPRRTSGSATTSR